MSVPMTRRALMAGALSAWATSARAALLRYDLVAERSTIAFTFLVNGMPQTGTMPVDRADIRVDPDNLAASSAVVTANVRDARTGLIFITQALLSAEVLDAENHPFVTFRSTAVRLGAKGRISEGAFIDGELNLRGVTRPITFDAALSRPAGSAPDDLSTLYIQLGGRLSRADYGASGYPALVDDMVTLDIRAEIRLAR